MKKQSQDIEQALIEAIKNNDATISVFGTVRNLKTGRFVGKISLDSCIKCFPDKFSLNNHVLSQYNFSSNLINLVSHGFWEINSNLFHIKDILYRIWEHVSSADNPTKRFYEINEGIKYLTSNNKEEVIKYKRECLALKYDLLESLNKLSSFSYTINWIEADNCNLLLYFLYKNNQNFLLCLDLMEQSVSFEISLKEFRYNLIIIINTLIDIINRKICNSNLASPLKVLLENVTEYRYPCFKVISNFDFLYNNEPLFRIILTASDMIAAVNMQIIQLHSDVDSFIDDIHGLPVFYEES